MWASPRTVALFAKDVFVQINANGRTRQRRRPISGTILVPSVTVLTPLVAASALAADGSLPTTVVDNFTIVGLVNPAAETSPGAISNAVVAGAGGIITLPSRPDFVDLTISSMVDEFASAAIEGIDPGGNQFPIADAKAAATTNKIARTELMQNLRYNNVAMANVFAPVSIQGWYEPD